MRASAGIVLVAASAGLLLAMPARDDGLGPNAGGMRSGSEVRLAAEPLRPAVASVPRAAVVVQATPRAAVGGAMPASRAPPPAAPSWTWGVSLSDGAALYSAWRAYAATQGPDAAAALELAKTLLRLDHDAAGRALAEAARVGDWRAIGAALAAGALPHADDPSTRALLRSCADTSAECAFLAAVLALSPEAFAAVADAIARDVAVCGLPMSAGVLVAAAQKVTGSGDDRTSLWCAL